MSAEDRLRDILNSEAADLVPAGDALGTIRDRVGRRRRTRMFLVPAGALATAAAVVAVVVLTGNTNTQKLQQDPIIPATPGPTIAPTTNPSPAAYTGPAIWPFTSTAQGEAWKANPGNRPWANDPNQVAKHFLADFAKLEGVTAEGGPNPFLVSHGKIIGTLSLVQISPDGPWTVTGTQKSQLTISSPAPVAAITSPTKVTGRVPGVDENVRLQLISSGSGALLADTSAPAGGAAPWEGTLTWSDQNWFTGGLIAVTRSLKDGAVTRITAIPVKRGT